MGDQALVQLTGEHGDAVYPGVVPKPVAGHADLAAAGLEQHHLIEVGPLLDKGIQSCRQGRRPGSMRNLPPETEVNTYLVRLLRCDLLGSTETSIPISIAINYVCPYRSNTWNSTINPTCVHRHCCVTIPLVISEKCHH
jgi:hypothetical protein